MHLADAFIQSNLQYTQVINILSVYVRHTSHNLTVVFSLFSVAWTRVDNLLLSRNSFREHIISIENQNQSFGKSQKVFIVHLFPFESLTSELNRLGLHN